MAFGGERFSLGTPVVVFGIDSSLVALPGDEMSGVLLTIGMGISF